MREGGIHLEAARQTTNIKKKKGTSGVHRSNGFVFIITLILAAFMAIPFVLIIGNSFKPLDELWRFPPRLIPRDFTLQNYADILNIMSSSWVPFLRYLANTVMITAVGTFGHLIFASMCAYPLAKRRFPGSRLLFGLIVATLMFNANVTAIPNYLTMSKLGLINTSLSLILPAISSSLGLYLMKQFMEQIPDSLLEAARIDGAGQWATFWQIVMPNVKPAWLTLILLSVQSLWNVGATNYIFDEQKKTLAYALSQITASGIARAGVSAAVSVLMLLVPVTIFIITQSNIIETMSTSGMKE